MRTAKRRGISLFEYVVAVVVSMWPRLRAGAQEWAVEKAFVLCGSGLG
jgi:hypothetical protein